MATPRRGRWRFPCADAAPDLESFELIQQRFHGLAQTTMRLGDPRLDVAGSQGFRAQKLRFDLLEFGGDAAQLVAILDSAPVQQVGETPRVIGDAGAKGG
ncbi:MAG TPA: hypothetical protein VFV98_05915 [Vicinamibacterales bacterium]|nr:hypothetical protein [Vicinamibacterales bacterium]